MPEKGGRIVKLILTATFCVGLLMGIFLCYCVLPHRWQYFEPIKYTDNILFSKADRLTGAIWITSPLNYGWIRVPLKSTTKQKASLPPLPEGFVLDP
ncbi:MAG: hypothetical protein WC329_02900 [Candidatus Omnitrophota bacterium]|jgi:hypothetical protein